MQTVNIAELKNNLSAYLEKVRMGEEVIVKDRNRPIARLLPLAVKDVEAELVAQGVLRFPEEDLDAQFWKMPRPKIKKEKILAAIKAERDED